MEEVRGEQQLEACKKALALIEQIWVLSDSPDAMISFLSNNNEWFSMNQILLPHTFVENWRSLLTNLRWIKRKDDMQCKMEDGHKRDGLIEKLIDTDDFVGQLVLEMDRSIRKELKLEEIKIRTPHGEKNYNV
jgi:hypothetical protein